MMHQQTPPHVKRWLQNTWKFLNICDKEASLVKMLQEENAKLRADRDELISEKEILISEKKEELVNAAKELEGLREQLNRCRSENITLSAKFQDMKEKVDTFIQRVSFFLGVFTF